MLYRIHNYGSHCTMRHILRQDLYFYLQGSPSEHSSTSHRLFVPICLIYCYSLQIKMGLKKKYIYIYVMCGIHSTDILCWCVIYDELYFQWFYFQKSVRMGMPGYIVRSSLHITHAYRKYRTWPKRNYSTTTTYHWHSNDRGSVLIQGDSGRVCRTHWRNEMILREARWTRIM
jgi:hypothetical protein